MAITLYLQQRVYLLTKTQILSDTKHKLSGEADSKHQIFCKYRSHNMEHIRHGGSSP